MPSLSKPRKPKKTRKPLRVTCEKCGKRRQKAITTNPITNQKRKSPKKICQECHEKWIDYRFFDSSFGQWLRYAFKRQCQNSIPEDTADLRDLIHLWKKYVHAKGLSFEGEKVTKKYDYQLCHIDPVKQCDGKIGCLTASNLMIAPETVNRELSNLPYPFTSKSSVPIGEAITDDNFKAICRERYDIKLLIKEFNFVISTKKQLNGYSFGGVDSNQVLSMELNRLGYDVNHMINHNDAALRESLVNEVYETFFKVGGVIATGLLAQYGQIIGKGSIEYDFTLPIHKVEQNKENKAMKEKMLYGTFDTYTG